MNKPKTDVTVTVKTCMKAPILSWYTNDIYMYTKGLKDAQSDRRGNLGISVATHYTINETQHCWFKSAVIYFDNCKISFYVHLIIFFFQEKII